MTGDVGPDPIRAGDEGGQGFLTLLPWLILSAPVVVGETAFVPVTAKTARRRLLGATGATGATVATLRERTGRDRKMVDDVLSWRGTGGSEGEERER